VRKIYTDGSASPETREGGYAVVDISEEPFAYYVYAKNTTNNRMELSAVLHAMELCGTYEQAEIFSDSQYVVDGINDWMYNWETRGWKNVKNDDLWKKAYNIKLSHNCLTVSWLKGHDGNRFNELADKYAVYARVHMKSGKGKLKVEV